MRRPLRGPSDRQRATTFERCTPTATPSGAQEAPTSCIRAVMGTVAAPIRNITRSFQGWEPSSFGRRTPVERARSRTALRTFLNDVLEHTAAQGSAKNELGSGNVSRSPRQRRERRHWTSILCSRSLPRIHPHSSDTCGTVPSELGLPSSVCTTFVAMRKGEARLRSDPLSFDRMSSCCMARTLTRSPCTERPGRSFYARLPNSSRAATQGHEETTTSASNSVKSSITP